MNLDKLIDEVLEEELPSVRPKETGSYLQDIAKELHQLNINIKTLVKEVGKRR